MKFNNAKEMLETLKAETDLYNKETEKYVFNYNLAGSICVYTVGAELAAHLKTLPEYWGANLGGMNGEIYDDPTSEYYTEDAITNMAWCEQNFEGEWEDVTPRNEECASYAV